MILPNGRQIRILAKRTQCIVGCSREMVGRVLKTLEEQGMIETDGKAILTFDVTPEETDVFREVDIKTGGEALQQRRHRPAKYSDKVGKPGSHPLATDNTESHARRLRPLVASATMKSSRMKRVGKVNAAIERRPTHQLLPSRHRYLHRCGWWSRHKP